jgi:hypothetical protein
VPGIGDRELLAHLGRRSEFASLIQERVSSEFLAARGKNAQELADLAAAEALGVLPRHFATTAEALVPPELRPAIYDAVMAVPVGTRSFAEYRAAVVDRVRQALVSFVDLDQRTLAVAMLRSSAVVVTAFAVGLVVAGAWSRVLYS